MHVRLYTDADRNGLVLLAQSVAERGGAVGFVTVPTPEEVDVWRDDLLARAELLVAVEEGEVLGCGALARTRSPVLRAMAQVTKVMSRPDVLRKGVGRAVLGALIARAEEQGVEVLTLEVRGNNHGAQRLYASFGFTVTGRRPDAIAVGDERWDQVLMHCDLRRGPVGLIRHGSRREGLGSS